MGRPASHRKAPGTGQWSRQTEQLVVKARQWRPEMSATRLGSGSGIGLGLGTRRNRRPNILNRSRRETSLTNLRVAGDNRSG